MSTQVRVTVEPLVTSSAGTWEINEEVYEGKREVVRVTKTWRGQDGKYRDSESVEPARGRTRRTVTTIEEESERTDAPPMKP